MSGTTGGDAGAAGPDGRYAVAWSGGKDSALALHRARTRGLRVTHLFNLFDGESGRVPFHGVRRELIAAQAEALGLELIQTIVGEDAGPGGDGEDVDDFEAAFLAGLGRLADAGVEGLVFGNIHLEDVRAWYEERVRAGGLEHVEPLWGGDPARLAREFVTFGYRGRVVSVNLESGDPDWLGRDLDADLLDAIGARPGVDPCGERGEFHSFVWDGPLFLRPVRVRPGETVEMKGHRLLDLEPEPA